MKLQTIIKRKLPNFPAYISGHSTFSGAAARILSHIVSENAVAYDAMAKGLSVLHV